MKIVDVLLSLYAWSVFQNGLYQGMASEVAKKLTLR